MLKLKIFELDSVVFSGEAKLEVEYLLDLSLSKLSHLFWLSGVLMLNGLITCLTKSFLLTVKLRLEPTSLLELCLGLRLKIAFSFPHNLWFFISGRGECL